MRQSKYSFLVVVSCCLVIGACLVRLYHPYRSQATVQKRDEMGEPDENPLAREQWELERLCDPKTGLIPKHMRRKELDFAARLDNQALSFKGSPQSSQSLIWNQRGPTNIGGRTRALAFDITNDHIILAAAVAGGVWRSENQGVTWRKISTPNELQNVTTIVQDTRPGHTNVWYYGTGEHDGSSFNGERYSGDGLYKSTDGGLKWKQLSSTASGTPQKYDQMFDYVFRLAVDSSRSDQDVLYAAATKGILRSSDGGLTWKVVIGSFDLLTPAQFTDVAVTPDGVVYAALSSGSPQWSGIWRSADGINWKKIDAAHVASGSSKYGRIVIGLAPTNKRLAYFLIDNSTSCSFLRYEYLSGDGSGSGGSWTSRDANIPPLRESSGLGGLNVQSGYVMALAVHPADENIVYIGGSNLYRSTDGFATTSNVSWVGGYNPNASPQSYLHSEYSYPNHHADVHALAFSPKDPNVMLSGTDGGVAITRDDHANPLIWTSLDHGYLTSEFFGVAIDHGSPGDALVMGGMQDNGTSVTNTLDASVPWTEMRGDDGGYCAVADRHGPVYVSTQNGKVYKGQVDRNLNVSGWAFVSPAASGFLFITPLVMDPVNNNLMYLAVNQEIWRENDLSQIQIGTTTPDPNWQELTATNTISGHVTAVAASTQPANILYYGTNDGRVFRLDSAQTTLDAGTDVSGSNFPAAYVARIAVDPHDAKKAMVVFSNYNVPSLFYTTDGGNSWKDVSGSLEQFPDGSGDGPSCRGACILHRGDRTIFYVGTSIGLFSTESLDGSAVKWQHESPDLIGTEIVEMIDARESDGFIAVATYGEGIFTSNVPMSGVEAPPSASGRLTLKENFPNPARLQSSIRFALSQAEQVSVWVYDAAGRPVASIAGRSYEAGDHTIPINTQNFPSGSYRFQLEAGGEKRTGEFLVER